MEGTLLFLDCEKKMSFLIKKSCLFGIREICKRRLWISLTNRSYRGVFDQAMSGPVDISK
jgi:hypothetical protein